MASLRRNRPPTPPQEPFTNLPAHIDTLTASAVALSLNVDKVFRMRTYDQEWQNEAWRHYDLCGEYRFVANRHSAAMSRARLYIADVDEAGNIGKETKNPKVRALAASFFGSEATKAENIRQLGINLYVAGECYIVAEGAGNPKMDRWYVVSRKELRKLGGGLQVRQPLEYGGEWYTLNPNSDLCIRVWSPHPRLSEVADSPTRAVLPILRELERLNMLVVSQVDSRLISAGLLLIPQGLDFPRKDGQSASQGLGELIIHNAQQQLSGAGTAAGLVPIVAEVPLDVEGRGTVASSVAHIKFDTPLTAEIGTKTDQAIRRLALGLDVAPEDLLGQGDANHWGSWQIEESSIKMFIEPALVRLCAGLNVGHLAAALKAMNLDSTRFTWWYDVSALVNRPNRQADAVTLYEQDELSGDELRMAGGWGDEAKPSVDELTVRRLWALAQIQPNIISDEKVAKLLGLPLGIKVQPTPPAPPPGQDTGQQEPDDGSGGEIDAGSDQRALPSQPTGQETPAQAAKGRGAMTAAAMMPGAEQVVMRALEMAGGKLLDRHNRGKYPDVPRHELHTRIRPSDSEHAYRLMEGAWAHVPDLAAHYGVKSDDLQDLLSSYCAELLMRGFAHSPELLGTVLTRAVLPKVPA